MPTRYHHADFPTTRWSLVLQARNDDAVERQRTALSDLCASYWLPIYVFARRSGCNTQDAEDMTQNFFSDLVKHNLLQSTDPSAGRLRTYFLKIFSRNLADERRAHARLKRGGGLEIISIDLALAESHLSDEPSHNETPERLFGRVWATRVLESAMQSVAQEYAAAGKTNLFTLLRPALDVQGEGIQYDQLSTATGLSRVAARQAVFRLRERFRDALRRIVADTLANPTSEAIDEEVAALQASLG